MDPLERLLRDANPVSDTSDSPRDRDERLRALLSELQSAEAAPGRKRTARSTRDRTRPGEPAAGTQRTVGRQRAPGLSFLSLQS
ncbi:hypothetical protein ACW0JT_23335 [Arthrobacter sp. SA17]